MRAAAMATSMIGPDLTKTTLDADRLAARNLVERFDRIMSKFLVYEGGSRGGTGPAAPKGHDEWISGRGIGAMVFC